MIMDNTIEVKLDKHDLKLIFESICMYDLQKNDDMTDDINSAFHYLYNISKKVAFDYDT